jgi:preprotein translocase subunit YajC
MKLLRLLIIIVVVAGGVTAFVVVKNQHKPAAVSAKSTVSATPSGSITPTQLIQGGSQYINKSVRVYGIITKLASGQYVVVDQTGSQRLAVELSTTKNINFEKYADATYKTGKTVAVKPATVSGKFTVPPSQTGQPASASLVVTSVQQ